MNFDIDLDEYDIVPDLNNSPDFTMMADELTPLIKRIKKLPYGVIAILAYGIKDILTGIEKDIPENLHPIVLNIYYLIIGAMMTKDEVILQVSKEDISCLNEILLEMIGVMKVLELVHTNQINPKYENGEWFLTFRDNVIKSVQDVVDEIKESARVGGDGGY